MPNGFKFGDQHCHTFSVEMTGKEVPITPPFTNNAETQAGIDGGWDFGMQYEPKIIPVDVYLWEDSRMSAQSQARAVAGWLNPRAGSQILIFDDEPDIMYYARLNDQLKIDEVIKLFNEFTIEFICYDPFAYSIQEYSQLITTSGTINHMGTHVSQPVLIIDHKGGSATVKNVTPDGSEQSVVLSGSSPAGTYRIDMKAKTVLYGSDGGDKYIESLQWIEMPQGTNTITHGVNINNVTVNYRTTWL
jgi:predicted phage tail component-like protein